MIWVGKDGDRHLQAPEYGRTIYRDTNYSGPLSGGSKGAMIVGSQEGVVSGGNDIRNPTGGGRGGKGKRKGTGKRSLGGRRRVTEDGGDGRYQV